MGLGAFDHFGSLGSSFVVRIEALVGEPEELGERVAKLLGAECRVAVGEAPELWIEEWDEMACG